MIKCKHVVVVTLDFNIDEEDEYMLSYDGVIQAFKDELDKAIEEAIRDDAADTCKVTVERLSSDIWVDGVKQEDNNER